MVIRTLRISHPALFGTRLDETIRFYTEILGMEIVLRQPNLDDASMEHLFFHVGEDNFIAYFLTKNEQGGLRYKPARPGIGGMNHLAIDVDEASFEEALDVACRCPGLVRPGSGVEVIEIHTPG